MATYHNLQEALPTELRKLLQAETVASRNGATKERRARRITLRRPLDRYLSGAARDANPFAQVAETLWVLGGRNDIAFLEPYLSHAPEFSDDGATWRAGYGPRLRAFGGTVDQIDAVLRILHADPQSRRAVIGLWDPTADYVDSRDIPCSNWLQFLARDGTLDAHVVMRSNDVMWGWSGINVFEWSVLQEVLAVDLGMRVGNLTFFAGSFHLYERHWQKARRIVAEASSARVIEPVRGPTARIATEWAYLEPQIVKALEIEAELRAAPDGAACLATLGRHRTWLSAYDPWLRECVYLLGVYALVRRDAGADALKEVCKQLSGAGLRAAVEWLERRGLLSDSSSGSGVGLASRPLRGEGVPAVGEGRETGAEATTGATTGTTPRRGSIPLQTVIDVLAHLEEVKSASYGDSWKKYGELLSIFPNIMRKVDRLEALMAGARATSDESLWDTVGDCAVYLAKYLGWQMEEMDICDHGGFAVAAQYVLRRLVGEGKALTPLVTTARCVETILAESQALRGTLMTPIGPEQSTRDFRSRRWESTTLTLYAALQWLALSAVEDAKAWERYCEAVARL